MSKRTLDSFLTPSSKRPKQIVQTLTARVSPPPISRTFQASDPGTNLVANPSTPTTFTAHETYPHPIANLPEYISNELEELLLSASGRSVKDQPHLDLLYFEPLIPRPTADELFKFLRSSLPFYRVKYTINRFGKSIDINTPRYTTVFGVDETSKFVISSTQNNSQNVVNEFTRLVEASNPTKDVPPGKYKSCAVVPRPIPPCLAILKTLTEALTEDTYNFVLVNYYSTGQDSISFHSDDERFLGNNPAIASFSLGARRDFLLKHKPPGAGPGNGNKGKSKTDHGLPTDTVYPGTTQLKLPLGSGDMILMRGETQRNWLHSIPKRSGKTNEADRGRINITMRKAMVPGGTENYYRYNVGNGPVYRWDDRKKEMVQQGNS